MDMFEPCEMKPYLVISHIDRLYAIQYPLENGVIVWAYTPKGAIRRARRLSAEVLCQHTKTLQVWAYTWIEDYPECGVWFLEDAAPYPSKIGPDGFRWKYGPTLNQAISCK